MDPGRLALIRSGTDEAPQRLGSGYLIAPRLVLTARHVLVDATGNLWPAVHVRIGHHCGGEMTYVRAEVMWHPDELDVALLRIDREVHLPGAVRWGSPAGTAPLRYQGLGYPLAAKGETRAPEHLRGELPPLSGSHNSYVLDQGPAPTARTDDKNAWGGASGAAIFCDDRLVGVVTEEVHSYGARRLIALPARCFTDDGTFVSLLAKYGGGPPRMSTVGASPPRAKPFAERTSAECELEQLLAPLFADPAFRVGHARDLARDLGYGTDGYEPTVADLAALVMAHSRGLASLGEAGVRRVEGTAVRAAWTHLFGRSRLLGASLLSLNEHEALIALLRRVCKQRPEVMPWAAREALRYVVLPETLSGAQFEEQDLIGVVEALEELSDAESISGGTTPVPVLLRLVEYVAAAMDDAALGDELRSWSSATAERLGVQSGALGERRADAARWRQRLISPVARVVMEVQRDAAAAEERYRCRILLARGDGSRSVLKDVESASKTPREAARCLNDAVSTACQEPGQGDQVPWVTVVVDRAGLDLAVDEWEPEADDFLPAWPIGAQYRVSLSCPELTDQRPDRESDQQRRWKRGRSVTLATGSACAGKRQLMHLLQTDHRDTAQIVLHGPATQRKSWLVVCLALGVPVVLWDRDADGYEDAERLRSLAPGGPPETLPERVRHFRSHSAAHPDQRRARPSLVWEPEGRHPQSESLHLRDPRRGTHAS
ncbi:trypsin-like peptidase domain-containing protein [Streptomyces sp. JJ36]|uniref:VMAP-C domain-containing protein n=1 Tax=Streptomyces sp. JJ36 TaxID=2736645 RepID=UPI001F469DDB|nr:trypsin-like peptidase domain-containing protein [Streptomyces sp. JJ36]MCF6522721.1 trypsin-like peptidase domain-containing protein [Streptomyces sp. JJ36]